VPTSITKEHINIVTWLLILMDFVFLSWRNITPKEIKQEVLQLTNDFRVPKFVLCVNNISIKHFIKNTLRQKVNMKPTYETQVVGNVTICGDVSHPSLKILDKVDAWHWKMLSSLQESFIKHSNQKKVESPRCPS
jgi:hypothetical protein